MIISKMNDITVLQWRPDRRRPGPGCPHQSVAGSVTTPLASSGSTRGCAWLQGCCFWIKNTPASLPRRRARADRSRWASEPAWRIPHWSRPGLCGRRGPPAMAPQALWHGRLLPGPLRPWHAHTCHRHAPSGSEAAAAGAAAGASLRERVRASAAPVRRSSFYMTY